MRLGFFYLIFCFCLKADMAGQYKEAASIAQKMNLGEARSFIAENKRDLLKDLNYQGNKVTKYASEVSLNSAAKTYESTARSKRKKEKKKIQKRERSLNIWI